MAAWTKGTEFGCAGVGCGLDWTPAPVCDAQLQGSCRYVACLYLYLLT